nr:GNAT family acetyltransferase [Thalassoroseus pseudoceratinae]
MRSFRSSDYDAVIALRETALPSSHPRNDPKRAICRKLAFDDGLFFVAERGGNIVGTVMAGYDGVRGWIYSLAVAEDARGLGVGRKLLEEVEQTLRDKGCDKINLQVLGENSQVVEFYQKCGFRVEDRISMGKDTLVTDAIAEPVPTIVVNPEIELSQIVRKDRAAYLQYLNESGDFYDRMGKMPFPYRQSDVDTWLMKVQRGTLRTHNRRNWAIRNADGKLIGGIGLFDITLKQKCGTGYWLAKRYWGQGIMTAVLRRLCEFAFETYRLQRMFAQALSTNPASGKVLQKAGFQLEGTLRNHFFRDGKGYDLQYFGRLNSPHDAN